jgi:long-chain acyl-CoA synthetase
LRNIILTPYSNQYWRPRNWPSYLPPELHFTKGERPLFEYLAIHAQEHPDRPALIFYGKEITYKEWDDRSNSVAQFLISAGIKKGDRVALHLPTFPGFAIASLGISKTGGVMTSCSPAFKEAELEHQLKDSGARILFCLDEYMGVVQPVLKKVPIEKVVVTGYRDFLDLAAWDDIPEEVRKERSHFPGTVELGDIFRNYPPVSPPVSVDASKDISLLAYTGGTTGLPKGAIHTFGTVIYKTACRAQINFYNLYKEEKNHYSLMMTPIYHISGMLQFNVHLYKGLSQVMLPYFHAIEALKAVDRYKPEILFTVTPMNIAMLNHPDLPKFNLRSIRRNLVASLGMQLTPEIADQWRKFLAEGATVMEHSFGLTETHTGDTFMPLDRPPKWGSVGIPAYGEEFKIVSWEDKNKVVPLGESGEIVVSSPSNFKGYWNKPQATAETLIDGWVYTGDIGRFDEEGYIYWLGRKKEMIKVSGFSVFPEEVELMMREHPAIAQCGVRGIPDPRKEEVIKAVVVLNPEFQGRVTPEELMQWAKERMSHYKVPRVIEIRDSLPASGTGKILRRLL